MSDLTIHLHVNGSSTGRVVTRHQETQAATTLGEMSEKEEVLVPTARQLPGNGAKGDLLYYDGRAWVALRGLSSQSTGYVLHYVDGRPEWVPADSLWELETARLAALERNVAQILLGDEFIEAGDVPGLDDDLDDLE